MITDEMIERGLFETRANTIIRARAFQNMIDRLLELSCEHAEANANFAFGNVTEEDLDEMLDDMLEQRELVLYVIDKLNNKKNGGVTMTKFQKSVFKMLCKVFGVSYSTWLDDMVYYQDTRMNLLEFPNVIAERRHWWKTSFYNLRWWVGVKHAKMHDRDYGFDDEGRGE